jgi:PAS domain S-box-containing protein
VDVIIASDDHALNFMLNYGRSVFSGVPVVFCSVSGYKPQMHEKLKLTGLRESIDIRATVETALRLHPETEEIAVILDKSRTGQALKKKAKVVFGEFGDRLRIRYLEDLTVEGLKLKLPELPENTVVLLFIFRPDETGRVLSHEQNLQRLYPHCPFPIYAVWQFYLGHGIVGGRLSNGREEGRMAAHMALRILKGENATDIPLGASPVNYMFDYAELKRFDIDPKLLPEDHILINKPTSFYEAHKTLIWQIVLVFCLLILALFGVTSGLINTRRAERKLRRHEENLRTTLNSIGDAVIATDTEGIITRMNPAAEKLIGWRLEDVQGKRLGEVIRIVNAQTREPADDSVRCMLESGEIVGLANHTVLIGKDGVECQIADSAAPIRRSDGSITGVVLVFRDVTKDYQMRKALRVSEERYRSFVQNFRGIAFRGRMDFTPIFFHGATEEMTGYTEKELLDGKPRWNQIIRPKDLPALLTGDEEKLHSIPYYSYEREYRIVRKDEAVRWVHEIIQNVCDDSGRPARLQGAIYDITDRKQAENALRESQDKIVRLKKMESLGLLAGGVAHDLNNVLSGIVSYPELLLLDLPEDSKLRNLSKQWRSPDKGQLPSSKIY